MNNFTRRILILLFTFVMIFGSAASCNFFGEDTASLRYGILKYDQKVYPGGYAFVNSVKNFRDNIDKNGLNTQSGIKLVQFGKDKLFYIAKDKGLFKTDNGGKEWKRIYVYPIKGTEKKEWDAEIATNDSLKITDASFVTDDIFYIAGTKNEISFLYKTLDGGRSFTEIYNTEASGKKVYIEQIIANPGNTGQNTLFLVTSGGGVFKTIDAGSTWRNISIPEVSNDLPIQMGVLGQYGNRLFIIFRSSGLFISDNGETFIKKPINFSKSTDQSVGFDLSFSSNIDKLVQSPSTQDVAIIADRNIYLSTNLEGEFKVVKLPVEPSKININDVAIDSREGLNRLILSVDTKLFESKDRGASWSANDKINQPNVQYGNIGQIIIDPLDTNVIYLMLIDSNYRRGDASGFFFGL
jgi:hypothetical protein